MATVDPNNPTTLNSIYSVGQQAGPTPISSSIPAYSDSADKNLIGTCRLTNFTDATGQGVFSNSFRCEKLIAASSVKSNGGAIAAAVVFALLFAAAAGLLVFVWWRSRRINGAGNTAYPLKGNPEHPQNASELSSLQHQLSLERRRVGDLQAALLSQSSQSAGAGWSSAQPKDDREVKRSFAAIFGEIKDFAGNYYRGGRAVNPADIRGELDDILNECITSWDKSLADQKGRMLLVRIIVGEILRRAWVDGEFMGRKVGKAVHIVEREVTSSASVQQAQLWRLQTLTPLINTIDSASRKKNVTAITDYIVTLLEPFAQQQNQPAAKKYLENTVTRLSALYFSLSMQNAWYEITPYFTLSGTQINSEDAVYEHATCDDVEQRFDTGTGQDGREWSAAEGREVRGFVFPAVIKHGDGRGGGWEDGVVVVFKAQVVL
ncbi:hypothetical protein H072_436 [Dactylellina haptotyla CBS 200.50]|uniref:Uncharacterized protein n=1 Tax=Dactylellina haptotyla (strain CBS 200.50) TaxID=1284197 RepID=S8AX39_DACHA|nr:hypothetical protein H072_436 [Dactylellina haptotyla CBS 200.50]